MSRSFDNSGDHLQGVAPATAVPLSMAIWSKRAGTGVADCLMSIGVAGSDDNRFVLGWDSTGAVFATTRTTASSTALSSTVANDTTTWHLCCAVFASATDRRATLDGGNQGTQSTSRIPAGINAIRIGESEGGAQDYDGLAAYAVVWAGYVLTLADQANLYAGATPLEISPGNIAAYWPLTENQSPEPDEIGSNDLTVTGTTFSADDPLVSNPPSLDPTIDEASIADPLVEGTSEVLTGSNLEPAATNVTVFFGSAAQTVTAGTATTATFTCSIGTQLYGAEYDLIAVNSNGLDSSGGPVSRAMSPPAGQSYYNCPGPLATSGARLTAIPDLLAGGQVHVVSRTGGAGGVEEIEIFEDGSFAVYDEAITAFLVRGNNGDGDGWGATASQEVAEPVDSPPEFDGPDIADISASLGDVLSVDVSAKFSDAGALTFSSVGTYPQDLTVTSAGVIQGTLVEAGVFTGLRVRALNGDALTADSNAYTISVDTVVPDVEGLTQAAATNTLEAAYLSVGIEQVYSEVFAAGIVRAQSIVAGTVVGGGTLVTLTVSAGVRPVLRVDRTRAISLREFLLG